MERCRDIPGKELVQYYDEEGKRNSIDSGDMNEYIKELAKDEFTSKDFRTWAGTVQCLLAFHEIGKGKNKTQAKKNIVTAIDTVAASLGNTRSICKKHYVHPIILSCYESDRMDAYFKKLTAANGTRLGECEKLLMKILVKEGA